MELMKLRNGSEVAKPIVTYAMMATKRLAEELPFVLFEAVKMARNPDYKPSVEICETLESYGLLKDGEMRRAVRDVIASAASGEGWDVTIGSPVAAATE